MTNDVNNEGTALTELEAWYNAGWIRALDLNLARFLQAEQVTDERVLVLAVLLSHQVGRGHVCLPLKELFGSPQLLLNLPPAHSRFADDEHEIVSPLQLLTRLGVTTDADLAGALSACDGVADSPQTDAVTPLVYQHGALYLRRYWHYEARIASALQKRMQVSGPGSLTPDIAAETLQQALDELFPHAADSTTSSATGIERVNWQKLACANTLRSRFSVITGGPGTGKTYTVVRLLAMLQRLAAEPLRIRLAAPTGKAAARLKESISNALHEMQQSTELSEWQQVLQRIESDSSTLHKLLGVQQGTRKFRHHRGNPLSLDVLVVDEASMVDIELMDATLEALPAHAQLILLGDKDQLASVEAGAVLGQLCQGAEQGGYNQQSFDYLQSFSDTPLPDFLRAADGPSYLQHVVMLRVSRRFDGRSGVGHLAYAINAGDSKRAAQLLLGSQAAGASHEQQTANSFSDIAVLQSTGTEAVSQRQLFAQQQPALTEDLRRLCVQGFSGYLQQIKQRPDAQASDGDIDTWARSVLAGYSNFQLLTPVREGEFGVAGLNAQIERWLKAALQTLKKTAAGEAEPLQPPLATEKGNGAAQASEQWYEGRPVMVTENDYSLNLRNGDIGMVLVSPRDGRKRVVFVDSDNTLRWILPSRLREVQTVFAMTVHKSQGSEFTHTVMVLPEQDNPVLCRELVYTGVTRAKKQLTMVVPDWHVFHQSIQRRTLRAGRLHL
ncbi:exodeoxyribonuclease V subunit alpha [Aliidiomarina sedimenti]|uniref:RecBCD enzyme subunit RecD n=1 Tax=Aliidiomarina sedimenti TaxID=1933879 RepID=A0ABY0C2G2_9GAMM|nr:exodeoxyribonuclease V subunit alpha [Aliidiomarina sedimenti]RUO32009.1 exodeoxyribonuclease V subunit alpha [Aliidiomarina sedimenti]